MQLEEPQDLIQLDDYFVRADTGKRFLNYIIDLAGFYVFAIILSIILVMLFPAFMEKYTDPDKIDILERFVAIVIYAVYMGAQEALFKGKSLGKLITQTRAVNLNGTAISVNSAFARGLSRAVPFCVLSAFGRPCNPWQDRWTDTMVIDEKRSRLG